MISDANKQLPGPLLILTETLETIKFQMTVKEQYSSFQ